VLDTLPADFWIQVEDLLSGIGTDLYNVVAFVVEIVL